MFEFEGRTAVVTGAASGIGEALARRFAALGANVILADIDMAKLEEAAHAIGGSVVTQRTDVADPEAVQALADLAFERFGAVELLCNNAGIAPSARTRAVWEFAVEDWHWALGVNLMGLVHGLRSFVPRMIASGRRGHIVNTLSAASLIGGAFSPLYGASKHAALRATEGLQASLRETGAPIGVTALCPGMVATEIHRSERHRPAALVPAGGVEADTDADAAWFATMRAQAIQPDDVAGMVVAAIHANQFYLVTDDGYDPMIEERMRCILERRNPGAVDHTTPLRVNPR